jgi:hypothetical protein
MQKTLQTVSTAVGVFLLTMLVAVGRIYLYQNRDAATKLSPNSWLSDEDREALRDRKAANKKYYDKMSRELWQQYQAQQPQNGWGGWKK